jgi:hypothetical protein
MDIQVDKTYRTPNSLGQKRICPCHIIDKTPSLKNQERILKATIEKCQLTYKKCKHIRITSDLSAENLKAKKTWNGIFQSLK